MFIATTLHCKERMVSRNVTLQQIRQTIHNKIGEFYDPQRNNWKCFGMPDDTPYVSEPYLLVIYGKEDKNIKVISVMWNDKGGLKANGFNDL